MVFLRQARHDEEGVAQGLVERDGLRQLLAQQRVEADVRAAAFEAGVVEQLAQRFGVAPVVAGKLDRLVTHLPHGVDRANQVLRALVAHRVELEREGDLFLVGGASFGQQTERGGRRARSDGAGFEERSSRDRFGFHSLQAHW